MGPGRGLDRAGGPKRPRNRRGGRVVSVAIPADQRGRRTSRRGGGPPKLGNTEKPPLREGTRRSTRWSFVWHGSCPATPCGTS